MPNNPLVNIAIETPTTTVATIRNAPTTSILSTNNDTEEEEVDVHQEILKAQQKQMEQAPKTPDSAPKTPKSPRVKIVLDWVYFELNFYLFSEQKYDANGVEYDPNPTNPLQVLTDLHLLIQNQTEKDPHFVPTPATTPGSDSDKSHVSTQSSSHFIHEEQDENPWKIQLPDHERILVSFLKKKKNGAWGREKSAMMLCCVAANSY